MKRIAFISLLLLMFGFIGLNLNRMPIQNSVYLKKLNAYGCGPYFNGINRAGIDGKFITVLPGWGKYHFPIQTKNDSAQFYFDQGLNMYYSYHWREADASFKEASRFDSTAAICYWGQALALGPGYNFALHYKMRKEVPAVVGLMNHYAGFASEKEKRLILAMNVRYSADSTDAERGKLNYEYAKSMNTLAIQYPDNLDIQMLYVDAVMLIHAWDMWNRDGTPKKWTPELVQITQNVLQINPKHPAALHYYIHLTEASRHPEVGLESANTLKELMPGVAHMIHMSSHEYERNGYYALGVEVNDRADEDLLQYESLAENLQLAKHASHYFAVQAYCGLSGAMYKKGLADAIRCRHSTVPDADDFYSQWLYMMPSFTCVRLGKWQEILRDDSPPDIHLTYSGIIYDFARGMAFVNTGKMDSALGRYRLMLLRSADENLSKGDTLRNTAEQGAHVAEEILRASILFSEHKLDSAVAHINMAIAAEDSMFYTEPKDWPIPARQYLGAFYLRMGKASLAEKIYREDLTMNPGNGWSLLGLCQSLKAQNKLTEIEFYRKKYLHSFSAAEEIPPGSVYMN